jgi:predicted AAA+ superfamily ATPase
MRKKNHNKSKRVYRRLYNNKVFSLHNFKNIVKTEPFWFCLGAAFGMYCASSVFKISIENITIKSYINLLIIAYIFGIIYKDIYKDISISFKK